MPILMTTLKVIGALILALACFGMMYQYIATKPDEYKNQIVHWKENWQRVDEQVFTDAHRKLCQQDRWIIEGIYFRHLPERIEHCEELAIVYAALQDTNASQKYAQLALQDLAGNGMFVATDPTAHERIEKLQNLKDVFIC